MRPIQVLLCCAVMFSACGSGTVGSHTVADFALAILRSSNEVDTPNGNDLAPPDLTPGPSMSADAGSTPRSPIEETALDDGKILQILHNVNRREIELAQLALRRAIDVRIVSFAKMMIAQRTDAERKSTKLAFDEKITLTDSAIGDRIETAGKQSMKKLTAVLDPDFDKAYTDAMMKGQHEVLVLLREQLLAKATDPKLKQLVGDLIPKAQHDLDEAKKLSQSDTQLAVPN